MVERNSNLPTYAFTQLVQSVFEEVLELLDDTVEPMRGFRNHSEDWRDLVRKHLNSEDKNPEKQMYSAAVMHYLIFSGHYFKALHTISRLLDKDELRRRVNHNPFLFIIDVGCGGGAATVAALQILSEIHQESSELQRRGTKVHCLGTDINLGGIIIFNKQIEKLQSKLQSVGIEVIYETYHEGVPQDIQRISDKLNQLRDFYDLPYLSHVLLFQVNFTSPLQAGHTANRERSDLLERYGVSSEVREEEFGNIHARNYRTLFERSKMDFLHIITISTNNGELSERTREMANAIHQVFESGNHENSKEVFEPQTIGVVNPRGSYWYDKRPDLRDTALQMVFHAALNTIRNTDLVNDVQLNTIKNVSNLEKAWAKVRTQRIREGLYDEVDIKLFELDLESNLSRLSREIDSYVLEFIPAEYNDHVFRYGIPKGENQIRPKGINPLEEEILMAALIFGLEQQRKFLSNSFVYAYRINRGSTEFLYQRYNTGYKEYIEKSIAAAEEFSDGAVIRTDVASFFTRIVQDRMVESAKSHLALSDRVTWLLKFLLLKDVNPQQTRKGLVQGGIGSAYLANIYLTPLDNLFGPGNEWDARYHRFVDDIMIIVPDSNHIEDILNTIINELEELGLELNQRKTNVYQGEEIAAFLDEMKLDLNDPELDETKYKKLQKRLWILNEEWRERFKRYEQDENGWWQTIDILRSCLTEIGLFISHDELSRKINNTLPEDFEELVEKNKPSLPLEFPPIPLGVSIEEYQTWAVQFVEDNPDWVAEKQIITSEYVSKFRQAYRELSEGSEGLGERRAEKWLRFFGVRLITLGLIEINNELEKMLIGMPWIFRDSLNRLMENVVRQGDHSMIEKIIEVHETTKSDTPYAPYMRAMGIRSLRYAPIWTNVNIQRLFDYALKGNITERLMATETWLLLNPSPHLAEGNPILNDLIHEMNETTSYRLFRNYLLVLSRYSANPLEMVESDLSDSEQLRLLTTRLAEGRDIDLRDKREPSVIRHKYYSEYDLVSYLLLYP